MRLSVRRDLRFVNCDGQQSFRKNWDKFAKTSKIGTSVESLIAEFSQFFAKIIIFFFSVAG